MIVFLKHKNTKGLVSSHPFICPDFLQDPPGQTVGQGFQVGSHHLKGVEKTIHITLFFSKD